LYWGAAKIRLDIGMSRDALAAELQRTLDANACRTESICE